MTLFAACLTFVVSAGRCSAATVQHSLQHRHTTTSTFVTNSSSSSSPVASFYLYYLRPLLPTSPTAPASNPAFLPPPLPYYSSATCHCDITYSSPCPQLQQRHICKIYNSGLLPQHLRRQLHCPLHLYPPAVASFHLYYPRPLLPTSPTAPAANPVPPALLSSATCPPVISRTLLPFLQLQQRHLYKIYNSR